VVYSTLGVIIVFLPRCSLIVQGKFVGPWALHSSWRFWPSLAWPTAGAALSR